MKTLKFCFLVWSIMSLSALSAQDLDNYQPLESSGTLPKDLQTATYEQVANQQVGIAKETRNETKQKDLETFYIESNYALNELLRSGEVLYNDPVGDYVNDVVDEILKDQPALRKKLSVFVVKSPVANAFTHQRGVILVNTGLIARLETEAQLAFILCHEIAHYMLKHSQDIYLKTKDLQYGRGEYRKTAVSDRLLTRSAYSRDKETEADMEGLKLFLKTGYAFDNVADVFLLLERAGEPQTPLITYSSLWPESFLNDSSMMIFINKNFLPEKDEKKEEKGSFLTGFEEEDEEHETDIEGLRKVKNPFEEILKQVNTKTKEKDPEPEESEELEEPEYDESDTHPAASERKKIIEAEIAQLSFDDNNKLFLVSPARFANLRSVSQFESCVLFLRGAAYFDALYQALVLLQEGERAPYLYDMVGKALYGMAKYKLEGEVYPEVFDYQIDRNIPGSDLKKRLNYFNRDEFLWLAFDYNLALYKQDTSNIHRKAILTDILIDVQVLIEKEKRSAFFTRRLAEVKEAKLLNSIWEKAEEKYDYYLRRDTYFESKEGRKYVEKWQKGILNKGYKLGIDKIVVFDPLFLRTDTREEQTAQFVSSEQQQVEIKDMLKRSAEELDLELTILDSKVSGKTISAEYWNEIALISRWHKEVLNQEVDRIVSSSYGEIFALQEKYETPYFYHTGVLSHREGKDKRDYLLACCAVAGIYTAPLAIYILGRADETSYNYGIVYDLSDESTKAIMLNEMSTRAAPSVIEINLHYQLYQIKKAAKK